MEGNEGGREGGIKERMTLWHISLTSANEQTFNVLIK